MNNDTVCVENEPCIKITKSNYQKIEKILLIEKAINLSD